ncbi:MAG: class I SAM-dependent methyltransferase [Planctomycetaceae bacterium]|jgi:hypothetical protein|nr:class I SAM-dependent methyltransferase [Planctomycetaceae bacterium]
MEHHLTNLHKAIKRQFAHQSGNNIFCTASDLHFHSDIRHTIPALRNDIQTLTSEEIDELRKNYCEGFLKAFFDVNQYTYFDRRATQQIDDIFGALLAEIAIESTPIEEIEQRHFHRIKRFIANTNPSILKINHNANEKAKNFICAEYSAEFLIDLLGLESEIANTPILDIGCGKNGKLVKYLRKHRIDAYGIDRIANGKGLLSVDWFDVDYGENKWGLIVSNLSFCSHFLYHHLAGDKIAHDFAETYMAILKSLKPGAKWIYTPSIPFFEDLLPSELYAAKREQINEQFAKTDITKTGTWGEL